jgi:Flp pilus assembly protein TadD
MPQVALQEIIDGTAPLSAALGVGSDQVQAIAALGFQAYEQGRTAEAETIFEGLIALDATSYFGHAGLGALRLAEGKLDEAVGPLTKAAELNAKDATVHANLGEVLLRQGKLDEAAAQFHKSLELDPQQKDAGANRARAILVGMQTVLTELEKLQ